MSSYRHRWAILIPAEPRWIATRLRALRDEEGDGPAVEELTIIPGKQGYSVLAAIKPNKEDPEWIADAFSRELPAPVYLLDLAPGDETIVWRYVHGQDEIEPRDESELCRSLGCVVPDPPLPPAVEWRTVALVEGLSPDETRALLATAYAVSPWLHFDAVPRGTLIWSDHGNIFAAGADVWEAQPQLTIYEVASSHELGEFLVHVLRDDEIRELTLPKRAPRDPLTIPVDDILGERDRARILAALGIPPRLLDRD